MRMKRWIARAGQAGCLALALALSGPAGAEAAAEPPAAGSEPIPISDFALLPFLTAPQLSPDGQRVAAMITDGDARRIGIWQRGDDGEWALQTIPAGGVDAFRWAGDGRLLLDATAITLVIGDAIFPIPVRRVLVHDIATGQQIRLGSLNSLVDRVIFTDPEARYVLLSTQPRLSSPPAVHRVDLATGAGVEIERSRVGVWDWFADRDGVVRVGVDYGERRTRIHYRAAHGEPLRRADIRRDLRDGSVIDAIHFTGEGNEAYIITNSQTGRFGLYAYDFATDTLGAPLFEHDEVDVDHAVFHRGPRPVGVVYHDDRPRTRWFDPEFAALQRQLDDTFPGKTNRILGRSRDGNRIFLWSSAADEPGTYYIFDRAGLRMEPFASPYEQLLGRSFAPVASIRYESRDGVSIPAYLTLPPGREARGLPLVLLPHGGPFARDEWEFDPQVQLLASRGYAVLQPNFRGSTGYGRDHVERGFGELGGKMIDDMEAGVDRLVADGIVDPARVCIMGGSYGGYAALWAATRTPTRYRCAISWAGPSDLRRMLRYNARQLVPQRYLREWRRQIEGEERTDLDAVSPLRQAARLRVPVLIAHGESDDVVPVDQSRSLVRALERHNAPAEAVFYPGAGHDFTSYKVAEDYWRRALAFLAHHNPAEAE
jgi:dipeptidyl aminopeptidase/acylaminoacyl peptidase